LLHSRQLGTIQEYIDHFTELVDLLVAYEPCSDHRYYTTRLIDGLKDEIKLVILVQCPVDLDTACTLALLQEEAAVDRCKEFKKGEFLFKPRSVAAPTPLPLPLPPPRPDSSLGASQGNRRGAAASIPASLGSSGSKVAAL
jgi:hypothetical protein